MKTIGFIKEETGISVPFPGEAGGLSCPAVMQVGKSQRLWPVSQNTQPLTSHGLGYVGERVKARLNAEDPGGSQVQWILPFSH